MCPRAKKAFTLIELLVVVAIIAMLLAIVIPTLRRAKESAWNVICRNNLKQYGLAGKMYTEDYDALFPNAWGSIFKSLDPYRLCQWHDPLRNPLVAPQLAGSLWPYLGSQDKSHLCPVFDRFARLSHNPCPNNLQMEPAFGYSMNAYLGGFELSGATQYKHMLQVKTSDVRSPATIFFFAEENPWITTGRYSSTLNDNALCGGPQHPSTEGAWTVSTNWEPTGSQTYLDCFASFHKTTFDKKESGDSNVVFVDGHVDLVNWKNTYRMARWTNKMPALRQ
jgi:prepilin-type N-terminal cleavage/methylation domain-containing protein/prepilin-type processing-associated H-X9-DG protein